MTATSARIDADRPVFFRGDGPPTSALEPAQARASRTRGCSASPAGLPPAARGMPRLTVSVPRPAIGVPSPPPLLPRRPLRVPRSSLEVPQFGRPVLQCAPPVAPPRLAFLSELPRTRIGVPSRLSRSRALALRCLAALFRVSAISRGPRACTRPAGIRRRWAVEAHRSFCPASWLAASASARRARRPPRPRARNGAAQLARQSPAPSARRHARLSGRHRRRGGPPGAARPASRRRTRGGRRRRRRAAQRRALAARARVAAGLNATSPATGIPASGPLAAERALAAAPAASLQCPANSRPAATLATTGFVGHAPATFASIAGAMANSVPTPGTLALTRKRHSAGESSGCEARVPESRGHSRPGSARRAAALPGVRRGSGGAGRVANQDREIAVCPGNVGLQVGCGEPPQLIGDGAGCNRSRGQAGSRGRRGPRARRNRRGRAVRLV
jgi:hypothetical protein